MDQIQQTYGRFLTAYQPDRPNTSSSVAVPEQLRLSAPDAESLARYAGATFADGLYRLHPIINIDRFTQIAAEAFPEFESRIICFGMDWLGRQFALDQSRIDNGAPSVLLLDAGAGEGLEVPATFRSFHNEELVDYADAALAVHLYHEWRSRGGAAPRSKQCVGYSIPLFLGGRDTVNNLELIDAEVYWGIVGQLRNKTRTLPVGTTVGQIAIS